MRETTGELKKNYRIHKNIKKRKDINEKLFHKTHQHQAEKTMECKRPLASESCFKCCTYF